MPAPEPLLPSMSTAASSAERAQASVSGGVTAGLLASSAATSPALHALVPGVYEELRRQARRALRRESGGHTLQPTTLVHEACLCLTDRARGGWRTRAQCFGITVRPMPRIQNDHARARHAAKIGGSVRMSLGAVDVIAPTSDAASTHVLAFEGVVRRNVKPESVLLDDDGHALVADLDIARGVPCDV